ncbi:MAG: hypothetical protein P1V21_01310 [Rhizobiaceae bacterium]|nr:hypothetical protein [Rhizobiaceae bacterium]
MSVIRLPEHPLEMSTIKAVAAYVLWKTERFDTLDIATALDQPEWKIERLLHKFRGIAG